MKKIILISLVLLVFLVPVFSMNFYIGATGGADFSFYLPYDITAWGSGFSGMARFPLGATVMFELESFPFAFALNGGYFFELPVGLDEGKTNDMPFYMEGLLMALADKSEKLRQFAGAGIGVWLDSELPVLNCIAEYRAVWLVAPHFYLNGDARLDFTFDLAPSNEGKALGFMQAGLGAQLGFGVCF